MTYYVGIALVSGATLLLELALLRLFAVQQFYHFAFMAVSLALLGAGASGSVLSVRARRFSPYWLCIAFGVTTICAYLVTNRLPFDSFSIAWDTRQVLFLALYFLAVTVPFLFSGLLIGGELMAAAHGGTAVSHRVYGANLLGSALGSLSSLLALSSFGGEGTVLLAAAVATGSGPLLSQQSSPGSFGAPSDKPRRGYARLRATLVGLMLVAGIVALYRPPAFLSQHLSPYKTLSVLTQAIDTNHVLTDWNAATRIDVLDSGTIHVMPGLSLASPVGPPSQSGLLLDGDNLMPITGLGPDTDQARTLAEHLPIGLVYRLRPEGNTLVIESGTGMDVLLALAAGAPHVTAVEEDALIIHTIQNEFNDFTGGLYNDDRVTVVNQSGRVFARQPKSASYDVVILALTDTHRPVTSGAFSLTENYIYTVEAAGDYMNMLNENGLLMVTRWLQTPASESPKIFGTVAAALESRGDPASEHLIAFRTLRTMTILASRQPIANDEIEIIRSFLGENGFDPVYFPHIQSAEVNQINVLPEPIYHDLFTAILHDPTAVYADYRFAIEPATDDRPFFFHFFKWQQTPEILAALGQTWQPFGGSGFFVLVALLILVAAASAVFIIGPLLLRRVRHRRLSVSIPFWRLRVFIYFASLGLAFLFVEIPLAQRFILVLGQPVTALAIVIFTLLLFSGLGSLTVMRWHLPRALIALVSLISIFPLLLEPVSALALRGPEWSRILLTMAVLAPLGYLMGIPFASALRLVETVDPELVPWAWAINGSFSVISAVLAVMVALTWGFSIVLWSGAAAYLVAWLGFGRWSARGVMTSNEPLPTPESPGNVTAKQSGTV